MLKFHPILLAAAALIPLPAAAFSIELTFTGGLSTSQEAIFEDAAAAWESYITGYQPGIGPRNPIAIDIAGVVIDGLYGVLGSGGISAATSDGGFWLTETGYIDLDQADLDFIETDNRLEELAMHEIAHVIGYGILWEANNLYVNGSGQYTGAFALDAYRSEFDPTATFIPVEQEGGGGTADGHWDEINLGGGLTGITDPQGRDLANELMTGWDTPHPPTGVPTYLSQTTISSFADLGYTVVPEPPAAWLAVASLLAALTRRRN